LGGQLSFSKQTVERYLDLLEKAFVIKRIGGFSRNLRKEVTKSCRYYFLDNGVLNAVLNNFSPMSARGDAGALWENYLIAERLKKLAYRSTPASTYFWRTYDQQEIDWVEERDGSLCGFECKWSSRRSPKVPAAWRGAYPDAGYEIVSPDSFLSFVL
jgi:predicted AAA+ superfamily ATPase